MLQQRLITGKNAKRSQRLAQLEARSGRLDQGRALVEEALRLDPQHFDSLVTLAAIPAEFQDYQLAATYLQRALAIRKVPAVETMLTEMRRR